MKGMNLMRDTIFVALSDNILHAFDADETSIQNILGGINTLVFSGAKKIPYHEKDCECKYYSNADMFSLVNVARSFATEKRSREIAKSNSSIRDAVNKAYPYDEDADIIYVDGFPCELGPEFAGLPEDGQIFNY